MHGSVDSELEEWTTVNYKYVRARGLPNLQEWKNHIIGSSIPYLSQYGLRNYYT